jgi:hypothetical protein
VRLGHDAAKPGQPLTSCVRAFRCATVLEARCRCGRTCVCNTNTQHVSVVSVGRSLPSRTMPPAQRATAVAAGAPCHSHATKASCSVERQRCQRRAGLRGQQLAQQQFVPRSVRHALLLSARARCSRAPCARGVAATARKQDSHPNARQPGRASSPARREPPAQAAGWPRTRNTARWRRAAGAQRRLRARVRRMPKRGQRQLRRSGQLTS